MSYGRLRSISGRIAILVALLAVVPQLGRANEADLETRMRGLLLEVRETYGLPGITAAWVTGDERGGSVAAGLADIERKIPMTPESRMLAGSIGKTFVGALVLALENAGTLERSDRVAKYLGTRRWFDRLPNAERVTLGQLLTHTSGLPDHVHMPGVIESLLSPEVDEVFLPERLVAHVLDEEPLSKAGRGWAYSDTGYVLLGLAIEAATGREVFGQIAERFLVPLDLTATEHADRRDLEGLAVGYVAEGGAFGLPERTMDEAGRMLWDPVVEFTGGGFVSTSWDLARWGDALFHGRALAIPYLDRLLEGVPVDPGSRQTVYGAGVVIHRQSSRGPVYGHGGWIPGYVSGLRYYADLDVTIAFQINSDVAALADGSTLIPDLEEAMVALIVDALQPTPRIRGPE